MKPKEIRFTTDELKRVLFVAKVARFYAIQRYVDASSYLLNDETFLNGLKFKFSSACYLLHKISPEKFDEYGCTKYGETAQSREIAHKLYIPEIGGEC